MKTVWDCPTSCVNAVRFACLILVGQISSMANCYICGRPLNESRHRLRRRVKTGESIRHDYRSAKPSSVQNRYGPRIVCQGCAKWIDARDVRSTRWQWLQLAGALGLVLYLILAARFL